MTQSPFAPPRALLLRRLSVCALFALGATSCKGVDFHERRDLSLPIMEFGDSVTESHLRQKVVYSMEGAAGGLGSTAGGGCGCY